MITVFGSINLDLIGGVARLPRPGETVPATAFATAPGGKGANQALAARRAGAAVRMVGAVGEGRFRRGRAVAASRRRGRSHARRGRSPEPTGVALILVDRVGENVIVVVPGANGTFGEADAEALEFSPGDVLLLQLEVPVPAIAVAARRAREAGARVILEFRAVPRRGVGAPVRRDASRRQRDRMRARRRSARRSPAARLRRRRVALAERSRATVVVTLGRRRRVIAVEDGRRAESARRLQSIRSTRSARATRSAAISRRRFPKAQALEDALGLAAAAGSLACTRSGAQPAIPRREEVEAGGAPAPSEWLDPSTTPGTRRGRRSSSGPPR